MSENNSSGELTAKNALDNLAKMQGQTKNQEEFSKQLDKIENADENQIYEPPKEPESTLFMLNNNNPQSSSYNAYMKNVKAYNNPKQRTRYGTTSLIFAGIAVVCTLILMIAMVITQPSGDSGSSVMGWLLLTILAPTLGLGGGLICSLISAIVGIFAIVKSHKRTISWIGFFTGLIVLAGYVVTAAMYLF